MSAIPRALAGALVGDAVAMPVHWYYNREALVRDYGRVTVGFTSDSDLAVVMSCVYRRWSGWIGETRSIRTPNLDVLSLICEVSHQG
jgi:hypothetical protein